MKNLEEKIYKDFILPDILLQEESNLSYRKINKLSKDEKETLNNVIATKLLMQINRKFKRKDFIELEKTKGDITKFYGYKTIDDSINFLEKKLVSIGNEDYNYCVNTLRKTLVELKKNKNIFNKAFAKNNSVLIVLYDSISATLINETHSLMVKIVTAEKDNYGNFLLNIFRKKTNYKNREIYKALQDFIDISVSQKINSLVIKEGFDVGDFFSDIQSNLDNSCKNFGGKGDEFKGNGAGIILGIVGGILLIITLLKTARFLVYYFYNKRQELSNSIDELKEMLQLNIDSLSYRKTDKNSKEYEKIISKQEKWMERLDKLKHFVEIKDKTTDEDTNDDIDKANKEISTEVSKYEPNDYSSSNDTVLI